jgi:putative transcriptional regulator
MKKRKTKTKRCKSEALAVIHETVTGLCEAGVVDNQTMLEFDGSCRTPVGPPLRGCCF